MSHSVSSADSVAVCKVCEQQSSLFGQAKILKRHTIRYFRCGNCGFIQTEKPYWLQEAYSTAIAGQDVGIMARNLHNVRLTAALLNACFPSVSRLVDFGAGHGIFVRMMRDLGFNFVWMDRYASNDYARGFEYKPGIKCELLTAFEVLEHLEDPIANIAELMEMSENVFVSTTLVPDPPPEPPNWWYYVPSSGQHISFYTRKALQVIADRFDRKLLSIGDYHLFSRERQSEFRFRFAMHPKSARLITLLRSRPSLIDNDFKKMTQVSE